MTLDVLTRTRFINERSAGLDLLIDVVTSDAFEQSLCQLPLSMREIVIKKVRLLAENPAHPSLNAHRLKMVKGHLWECYIPEGMRLLYEVKDKCLYLWELGSHAIVDNVRLRGFAANTRFSRRDDILADTLPIPEQTRLWLEELSTSAELEKVMFDSTRLLYRSPLDLLQG